MHFQRLEDLRIDNDKTQAEVAKHLGLPTVKYIVDTKRVHGKFL